MIAKQHKVFCSFAFTGEDEQTVSERMKLVTETFKSAGVGTYCSMFNTKKEEDSTPKYFMDAALVELHNCDVVFIIMASERRSEGMLMEIGAAYDLKKKIILARHESANGKTYTDLFADKVVDWKTNEDLVRIIKTLIV